MPVKITSPIPSVEETADRVGVSRKRAAELARYAESHVAAVGAPSQTHAVRSLAESCEVDQKTARAFLDGLSSLAIAEVRKNGVFVLKGIGRLMRVETKSRTGRNRLTGETVKVPAKKVVMFRVAKAAKDAIVSSKAEENGKTKIG